MPDDTMSIVAIHWKVKKGMEGDFEKKWKTVFKVKNREGLIGEFLSKVERRDASYPYITWPIACENLAHEEQCTHYINVGLWTSHERFVQEVGQFMKDERPPENFESAGPCPRC